jgi:hypothetical protein
MAKWEHKIIQVFWHGEYRTHTDERGTLDELVADGWEILHVLSWGETGDLGGKQWGAAGYFLMRREVETSGTGVH